jgi:hypothetical protein
MTNARAWLSVEGGGGELGRKRELAGDSVCWDGVGCVCGCWVLGVGGGGWGCQGCMRCT